MVDSFVNVVDSVFKDDDTKKALFDYSQLLFCSITYDGYFKTVNKGWCDLLGMSEEEIKRIQFASLMHPDDVQRSMEAYAYFSLNKVPAYEMFTNRYRDRNGNYVGIQWFTPVYRQTYNDWLLASFVIPENMHGYNVYTEDYKTFLNGS